MKAYSRDSNRKGGQDLRLSVRFRRSRSAFTKMKRDASGVDCESARGESSSRRRRSSCARLPSTSRVAHGVGACGCRAVRTCGAERDARRRRSPTAARCPLPAARCRPRAPTRRPAGTTGALAPPGTARRRRPEARRYQVPSDCKRQHGGARVGDASRPTPRRVASTPLAHINIIVSPKFSDAHLPPPSLPRNPIRRPGRRRGAACAPAHGGPGGRRDASRKVGAQYARGRTAPAHGARYRSLDFRSRLTFPRPPPPRRGPLRHVAAPNPRADRHL